LNDKNRGKKYSIIEIRPQKILFSTTEMRTQKIIFSVRTVSGMYGVNDMFFDVLHVPTIATK